MDLHELLKSLGVEDPKCSDSLFLYVYNPDGSITLCNDSGEILVQKLNLPADSL